MSRPTVLLVELHPDLGRAIDQLGTVAFTERLEASVRECLTDLGIGGATRVEVRGGGKRAVVVRADGSTVSYPPSFLSRLWFGIAPPALRDAPDGSAGVRGFPDGWLIECGRKVVESGDEPGLAAIAELVARLVLEVIALRPSSLLMPEDAAALIGDGGAAPPLADREAAALLRSLLDLGVRLPDGERIRDAVRALRAASRSTEDTLEELFEQLRARQVEIEASPDVFAELTGDGADGVRLAADDPGVPQSVRTALGIAYGYRLEELGLRPRLVFTRVDRFELPEIRLKLNDRTSPSIPVPADGEIAVMTSPGALAELGVDARPLVDPVTGLENSAVTADASTTLEDAGFLPVPRVSYVAAAFARAATPGAHRVLSIDDVEEDLAAIEARFPVLVHATLARYTVGEITRLLRALAREQISIRDLRRILDILLSLADATETDLEEMFLDDSLPSGGDAVTPVWAGWVEPRLLAFVRARMRDRVCFDSGIDISSDSPVAVHETDDAFESLIDELVASTAGAPADDLLTRIRSRVWDVVDGSAPRGAILLTATRTRLALRRAIEYELPATPVIARAEIPATVRIERTATVTPA